MDLKTFQEQLEAALERPSEWREIAFLLLHRSGIQIRVPDAMVESPHCGLLVQGPDHESLMTVKPDAKGSILECLRQVRVAEKREREEEADSRRDHFLVSFRGFEEPEQYLDPDSEGS